MLLSSAGLVQTIFTVQIEAGAACQCVCVCVSFRPVGPASFGGGRMLCVQCAYYAKNLRPEGTNRSAAFPV